MALNINRKSYVESPTVPYDLTSAGFERANSRLLLYFDCLYLVKEPC